MTYTEELIARTNQPKAKGLKITPSAKNEILFKMKPKIPKSGKSLYKEFYIRSLDNTELIYHIPSGLFVARMNGTDGRLWIIKNRDEIDKRIQQVLSIEE